MKNNKVHLTDNIHVTNEMWNEIAAQREQSLKTLIQGSEAVREAILNDESYDETKFPGGFDIKGFIRAVVGAKHLGHPEVMDFRRSLTALASVVHIKLPENFILMDIETHTAATVLMKNAAQMRQAEMADTEAALDPAEIAARVKASSEKMDSDQLVKDVLAGNTTYDKDEDFMASGLVVNEEDAEVVSIAEAQKRNAGSASVVAESGSIGQEEYEKGIEEEAASDLDYSLKA